MARSKGLHVFLVFVVVLLVGMNIYQFWISYNQEETVKKEDVPVQIADLKGDDWKSTIGQTVSVEGYYVKNNGIAMLLSDPGLIGLRRPMNTSEYLRIDVALPDDPIQLGKYMVKGKVMGSLDPSEKIYLEKEKHSLVYSPIVEKDISVADIPVVVPPELSSTKYAVLISGGNTAQDSWPSFWNDLKFVYSVLVQKYYYDPANIYVLYNDGNGMDDQIPVDHPALISSITMVMSHLAGVMTKRDSLLFYASDHGGKWSTFGDEPKGDDSDLDEFIALWNKTAYMDDWLKSDLNAIECKYSIIILDHCFDGGFTWDLSRADRIIMTACTENQGSVAHPVYPYGDFTYNLFNAFDGKWWGYSDQDNNGKISVAEAFNYASATSVSIQTPTYDDNGDGIPHYINIKNGGGVEDEGRLGNTYL